MLTRGLTDGSARAEGDVGAEGRVGFRGFVGAAVPESIEPAYVDVTVKRRPLDGLTPQQLGLVRLSGHTPSSVRVVVATGPATILVNGKRGEV